MSLDLTQTENRRASLSLTGGHVSAVGVAALCVSLLLGAGVFYVVRHPAALAMGLVLGTYFLLSLKVVR
jgi:hypothetical protein